MNESFNVLANIFKKPCHYKCDSTLLPGGVLSDAVWYVK